MQQFTGVCVAATLLLVCTGVVRGDVATQCTPANVAAHPNLDVDKFLGVWYETYQNEGEDDNRYMSKIEVKKTGNDVTYIDTSYEDCQQQTFSITFDSSDPARITETPQGIPGVESNPAVVMTTDYDSYALYYQCFIVDGDGYCTESRIGVLQRCSEALSESKMSELQDMMDAACVDHTTVVATQESECFNAECATGGTTTITFHHLIMLMSFATSLLLLQ